MSFQIPGRHTSIKATEQAFPEFPDLLFGTSSDGIYVFDATDYLQKHKPEATVDSFFTRYAAPIESLVRSYDIPKDKVCMVADNSHFLIDGSLVYLFIAFVEPDFLAYACDRIHEHFSLGFCVSDTYLASQARSRLSKEVIKAMSDGNAN